MLQRSVRLSRILAHQRGIFRLWLLQNTNRKPRGGSRTHRSAYLGVAGRPKKAKHRQITAKQHSPVTGNYVSSHHKFGGGDSIP